MIESCVIYGIVRQINRYGENNEVEMKVVMMLAVLLFSANISNALDVAEGGGFSFGTPYDSIHVFICTDGSQYTCISTSCPGLMGFCYSSSCPVDPGCVLHGYPIGL